LERYWGEAGYEYPSTGDPHGVEGFVARGKKHEVKQQGSLLRKGRSYFFRRKLSTDATDWLVVTPLTRMARVVFVDTVRASWQVDGLV
jgi:hypothetical protein